MSRCAFVHQVAPLGQRYLCTSFAHARGTVDVNWYPPRSEKRRIDAIIVFFPGNPGLIDYYGPFFDHLHSLIPETSAIASISHVGHCPQRSARGEPLTLDEQISVKSEFVQCLFDEIPESTRVSLMGHSVGAEMCVQVMKRNPAVHAAYLLFPTLAHIARTPNGRRLQPIFHAPLLQLLPLFAYLLRPIVALLQLWSPRTSSSIYDPHPVTLSLLASPPVISHVLHLARSEMKTITSPDLHWYATNRDRIWSYWGADDGWVSNQGDDIKAILQGDHERLVDCADNIPHAFCLGESGRVPGSSLLSCFTSPLGRHRPASLSLDTLTVYSSSSRLRFISLVTR